MAGGTPVASPATGKGVFMTGLSSILSAAHIHGQTLGGPRAAGAASGSLTGPGASGNNTSFAVNADGSTTVTVTSAQGQVVSSSTTQAATPATIAAGFAQQANQDELAKMMPASLLNMVV
jgi:hypothetical protein